VDDVAADFHISAAGDRMQLDLGQRRAELLQPGAGRLVVKSEAIVHHAGHRASRERLLHRHQRDGQSRRRFQREGGDVTLRLHGGSYDHGDEQTEHRGDDHGPRVQEEQQTKRKRHEGESGDVARRVPLRASKQQREDKHADRDFILRGCTLRVQRIDCIEDFAEEGIDDEVEIAADEFGDGAHPAKPDRPCQKLDRDDQTRHSGGGAEAKGSHQVLRRGDRPHQGEAAEQIESLPRSAIRGRRAVLNKPDGEQVQADWDEPQRVPARSQDRVRELAGPCHRVEDHQHQRDVRQFDGKIPDCPNGDPLHAQRSQDDRNRVEDGNHLTATSRGSCAADFRASAAR